MSNDNLLHHPLLTFAPDRESGEAVECMLCGRKHAYPGKEGTFSNSEGLFPVLYFVGACAAARGINDGEVMRRIYLRAVDGEFRKGARPLVFDD